jgi:hypothetical protein
LPPPFPRAESWCRAGSLSLWRSSLAREPDGRRRRDHAMCQLDLRLLSPGRMARRSKLLPAEGDPGRHKREADQSKVDENRAGQIAAGPAECQRYSRR